MNKNVPFGSRFRTRQALAVALAALLVFNAGCAGFLGDGDGGSDGTSAIGSVPAGVDTVMTFESGIVDDPTTVSLMNGLIEMSGANVGGEQQSYEDILAEAESESELSRDGFHSVTVFANASTVENEQYAGMIAQTDWSWEDLIAASNATMGDIEEQLTEDSYNGVTVYKNDTAQVEEDAWIADFGDGTFAVGSSQAVKDVIDTRQGDAEPFSGDLRNAYENAEDGYMKMAMVVPEDQVSQAGQQTGVPTNFVPTPEIVTMTYYTGDNTMNLDAQMTMANQEEAEQFSQVVGATLDPPSDSSQGPQSGPFAMLVEATDVKQNGKDVTVGVSMTPDELLTVIESLQTFGLGGGSFAVSPNTAVTG
jgi:hypothetical protein